MAVILGLELFVIYISIDDNIVALSYKVKGKKKKKNVNICNSKYKIIIICVLQIKLCGVGHTYNIPWTTSM